MKNIYSNIQFVCVKVTNQVTNLECLKQIKYFYDVRKGGEVIAFNY